MAKRSYDQFCPLARTLDLLGERWTLLVIRDLLAGPKRYTDLRTGLEGIPSDILTQRLRDLEVAGLIVRRQLPPPAASTVYRLTDRGRELEPALLGLARFGVGLLGEGPKPEQPPTPERFGLLLRALFDPSAAGDRRRTVALESGDRGLWVSFGGGDFEVGDLRDEPPARIDATAAGEAGLLYELLVGRINRDQAVSSGALAVDGDVDALAELLATFPGGKQTVTVG
jgi:DNA-binding HxlR family transcriptional regulator